MVATHRTAFKLALTLCVSGLFAVPADADLNNVPDLTDAQDSLAGAVQLICPMLGAAGGGAGTLPPDQQDLFERCREMVQTSNQQQGAGATAFSLGLTESELRGALQNIGTEEVSAEGTKGTKTTSGQALGDRLIALRQGAGGLNLAALTIVLDGYTADVASLIPGGPHSGGPQKAAPGNLMSLQTSVLAPGESGDGAAPSERLGIFVNGMFGFGDRDSTSREPGFEFTSPGVVFGVDYRVNPNFVIGGAVGYEQYDADFDVTNVVSGGSVEADLLTVSIYGSHYSEKYYLDGVATFGWNAYDVTRRINYSSSTATPGTDRTARGEPDGTQYELSLTAGLDRSRGRMTYSPYLRLSFADLDIDPYTETGALGLSLSVADQEATSFRSDLGASFAWNISRKSGVIVPGFRAEWNHEFQDDVRFITARYASDPFEEDFAVPTDEPDTDFGTLAAAVNWVLKRGTQVFFDLETQVGREHLQSYAVTVGARFVL